MVGCKKPTWYQSALQLVDKIKAMANNVQNKISKPDKEEDGLLPDSISGGGKMPYQTVAQLWDEGHFSSLETGAWPGM